MEGKEFYMTWKGSLVLVSMLAMAWPCQAEEAFPRYKPSSRSAEPMDIRTNAYGASRDAPNAIGVGDVVPDFTLARAGGGFVELESIRARGPVTLIFYRGHW